MPIIESKRLSPEENLWLQSLGEKLSLDRLRHVSKESESFPEERVSAYLDVLFKENQELLKELVMLEITERTKQAIRETGLADEWIREAETRAEARVEKREREQRDLSIRMLYSLDVPVPTIARAFNLTETEVRAICQASGGDNQ